MTAGNYERALAYRKKKIDWKLRRKDERSVNADRNELCLVSDTIIITIDEIAQAVDASGERARQLGLRPG